MSARNRLTAVVLALPFALSLARLATGDIVIDWWTTDGGGVLWTTGGDFEVSGTIGQPDASLVVMTGGGFEASGGFWPGALVGQTYPRGDVNCDGVVNNQDIDGFILALFNPASYAQQYPDCNILNGDFTGDGFVNNQDIDGFVAALFGG